MDYYGFVYMTINLDNGKMYIGQKKYDAEGKWEDYLGSGTILTKAVKKHGRDRFRRVTLCECKTAEELDEKEIEYIKLYDANHSEQFYNITPGGKGLGAGEDAPWFGKKLSELTKTKLREKNLGEGNPFYGRHHSEETKKRMSEAREHVERSPKSGRMPIPVVCVETSVEYKSIADAARSTGINERNIQACICGKQKSSGGFHWMRAECN